LAAIRGQVPDRPQVLASEAVGTNIVMVDPARVFYSDNGIEVDYSEYASLQMDSAAGRSGDRDRRAGEFVAAKSDGVSDHALRELEGRGERGEVFDDAVGSSTSYVGNVFLT
jgi:hypothetical protein